MLRKLLEPATTSGGAATAGMSPAAREETKLRAAMMLSKVSFAPFVSSQKLGGPILHPRQLILWHALGKLAECWVRTCDTWCATIKLGPILLNNSQFLASQCSHLSLSSFINFPKSLQLFSCYVCLNWIGGVAGGGHPLEHPRIVIIFFIFHMVTGTVFLVLLLLSPLQILFSLVPMCCSHHSPI